MAKPTKVVVDLSEPKNQRHKVVELTAAEIESRKQRAAEAEAQRLAEEQAQAELEATQQSAKEKLATLGLTEQEIIALLGN